VSSTRHAFLAAIALVLWSQPHAAHGAEADGKSPNADASEWPTENSISAIAVKPGLDEGDWLLDFDYAFVGKPPALLRIELIPKPGIVNAPGFQGVQLRLIPLTAGRKHISTVLQYPGEGTSGQVVVSIVRDAPDNAVLASGRIDKVIQWPAQDAMDFRFAVDSINNGSSESLRRARQILERLIGKNPKYEPGYVELARVAMRSNGGTEGLHQAETLLDSALKISPDRANAKILLGYVYTQQGRLREAEALFADAARSDPVNTWLWTNWGEMLEKQGKADEAIAKYREALARPVRSTRYYGARQNAYVFLVKLLEGRKDIDGMEVLYKQRLAEFGPGSCYSADYAKFKLNVRGDAQAAIDLARGALELSCDDAPSRQILGLASYVQWAQGSGAASAEALHQARIYLPTGSMTLYLLASNDKTTVAVKKLIAGGEAIDQKDNEKMSALAHALQNGKLDAAERLLQLGASPVTPVSYAEMPVALLPVMSGDIEAIRMLQRAGVDYSKLRHQGATAIDYAKQMGDEELLKALKHKERAL
jgi:tetratricopeptide (TPR) repeat protein